MDEKSLKIELRKIIREEIDTLPDDYIAGSNAGILLQVMSLEEYISARNIMIYHSVGREPDTVELVKAALSSGKTVAFPYCFKGGFMQARIVESLDVLRPAMLGIPTPPDTAPVIAPEELDMIIVPALTYNRAGYRLGYGGGYYDRYLSAIPAITVGLARQRLMKYVLPEEPHDIAVKIVATENAALRTADP